MRLVLGLGQQLLEAEVLHEEVARRRHRHGGELEPREPFRWLRRLEPREQTILETRARLFHAVVDQRPVEQLAVTLPQSSALPESVAGFAAVAVLLACGAVVMIVRLGARLGRAGRVSAERVLFCFCAVYLILPCADAVARDPLPLAPAVAVLIGAGAHALLALAFGVLARRRAT